MTEAEYLKLKDAIIKAGYSEEIDWSESIKNCKSADDFFNEYVWIVLNSGMKNQVARIIQKRIYDAWEQGKPTSSAFGHKGKVKAIDFVRKFRHKFFAEYQIVSDKIRYLSILPWIGEITKFHLAKNLGFDCCKPDRHLVRISKSYGTTPESLCKKLAEETGDRIATVDLVIWRAANLRLIK
ncbi:MAG: hypothetical protein PHI99_03975 [Syntrophales bacterium]|jgi:hypothetical protein|nr:hypothetical protein [Syntrophales bacterium]